MAYFSLTVEQLGFFVPDIMCDLVDKLEYFSMLNMMITLVFDVLLIIFIIVACLLIYSLLLLSVESKTFDFAVMRLVGLTKNGFIGLILT